MGDGDGVIPIGDVETIVSGVDPSETGFLGTSRPFPFPLSLDVLTISLLLVLTTV
jgi:hypothetical protein